jgi:hypothetical protein
MPQLDVITYNTQVLWIAVVLVLAYAFWALVGAPLIAGSLKTGVKHSEKIAAGGNTLPSVKAWTHKVNSVYIAG